MKKILRNLLIWMGKMAGLIIVSAIIGTVLLILAARIPEEAMSENALEGAFLLLQEGEHPEVYSGVSGTTLDNFTDGMMLNIAYYRSDDLSEDALQGTLVTYEGKEFWQSLYYYFSKELDTEQGVEHLSKYWKGVQAILSPLLTILTYSEIRALNMALQIGLIFVLCGLLQNKGRVRLCVPVVIWWISLSPATVFRSLTYSLTFYPTIFLCILLTWRYGGQVRHTQREMVDILFGVCGILIAYLDFLTYPLVALGVPLILLLSLEAVSGYSLKNRLWVAARCSVSWFVAYGGMWVSKWVITQVICGEDVIGNALGAVLLRISHTDGEETLSWSRVLLLNAQEMLSLPTEAAIAAGVVLFVLLFWIDRRMCVGGGRCYSWRNAT